MFILTSTSDTGGCCFVDPCNAATSSGGGCVGFSRDSFPLTGLKMTKFKRVFMLPDYYKKVGAKIHVKSVSFTTCTRFSASILTCFGGGRGGVWKYS